MSIPSMVLAGKRSQTEPCSAALLHREQPEVKRWGRDMLRSLDCSMRLRFGRLRDPLEHCVVLFQPSLGWCMPRPHPGAEPEAQLWQGPIPES